MIYENLVYARKYNFALLPQLEYHRQGLDAQFEMLLNEIVTALDSPGMFIAKKNGLRLV